MRFVARSGRSFLALHSLSRACSVIDLPSSCVSRLQIGLSLSQLALPKVTQGLIAATNDWATWRLARVVLGDGRDRAAVRLAQTSRSSDCDQLVCSVLSLANAFITARTFSNSLETALTGLALSFWPWDGVRGSADVLQRN